MDQTLLLIPAPLVEALLEYLGSRPMREVEPAVAALRQLKPAPLSAPSAPTAPAG